MKKMFFIIFPLFIFFASGAWAYDYEFKKDALFEQDLVKIQKSIRTIMVVCFYQANSLKEVEGKGEMKIAMGRGVVFNDGKEYYLFSLKHIFKQPESVFVLRDNKINVLSLDANLTRFFAFEDWKTALWLKRKILNCAVLKAKNGGFISRREFEKSFSEVDIYSQALELKINDFTALGSFDDDEAVYFKLKKNGLGVLSGYLDKNDCAWSDNFKLGQQTAVIGLPKIVQELYREGVIAGLRYYSEGGTKFIGDWLIVSIPYFPGDSGSPIIASVGGRLRVIGFSTAVYCFEGYGCFGGIFTKIYPFLKGVGVIE